MKKGVEGVVRAVVGEGAIFASVAEDAGGKEGEGPVVGRLVVGVSWVGVLDSSVIFWKRH
jgi:hypothetical protein